MPAKFNIYNVVFLYLLEFVNIHNSTFIIIVVFLCLSELLSIYNSVFLPPSTYATLFQSYKTNVSNKNGTVELFQVTRAFKVILHVVIRSSRHPEVILHVVIRSSRSSYIRSSGHLVIPRSSYIRSSGHPVILHGHPVIPRSSQVIRPLCAYVKPRCELGMSLQSVMDRISRSV